MKDVCPWCKHNPFGCEEVDCDFRTLPYEKEAIIGRLVEERKKIDAFKERMSGREMSQGEMGKMLVEVRDVVDVSRGMQVMVDRLVADFGMTEKEVHDAVGFDEGKMSMVQKAKLWMKLRELKKRRTGADGSEEGGKIPRWPNR